MPRIVTDAEKQRIRDAMHENVVALIKKKSLRKITVDDITKATNIGKGSFYMYYNSKEELLYEVIKRCERELAEKVVNVQAENISHREKIRKAAYEMYLAPGSIVLYLNPSDLEHLLHRLPEKYHRQEKEKAAAYFEQMMNVFALDPASIDMAVLARLMDALNYVASDPEQSTMGGREKALDILVNAIVDYLAGEESKP